MDKNPIRCLELNWLIAWAKKEKEVRKQGIESMARRTLTTQRGIKNVAEKI
jgi:hypothetical protein